MHWNLKWLFQTFSFRIVTSFSEKIAIFSIVFVFFNDITSRGGDRTHFLWEGPGANFIRKSDKITASGEMYENFCHKINWILNVNISYRLRLHLRARLSVKTSIFLWQSSCHKGPQTTLMSLPWEEKEWRRKVYSYMIWLYDISILGLCLCAKKIALFPWNL